MTKKVSYISLFAIFLLIICLSYSNLNVFGAWQYHGAQSQHLNLELKTLVVPWEGADVLPEDTSMGKNHVDLIERILNSTEGINHSTSFLNEYIKDRINDDKDTVSSVAPTPGGNLKNLFNTPEMAQLDFMMYITVENGVMAYCDLYTFDTALAGNKIGTEVNPVYKTCLEKIDGVWEAVSSYAGKSITIKYDAKQGGTRITVSPTDWVEVIPPTN